MPDTCFARVLAAALLCLCVLIAGCSGGSGAPGEPADSAAQAELPEGTTVPFAGLPGPHALLKNASEPPTDLDRYRTGAQFASSLVHANVDSGLFSPNWAAGQPLGNAAYAVYSFPRMSEYEGPARVRCLWESTRPSSVNLFIGMSDFARDRWKWFPADSNGDANVGSFDPYEGPGQTTLVAVVVIGEGQFQLQQLLLGASLDPYVSITTDLSTNPFGNIGEKDVNINCSNSKCIGANIVNFDFDFEGDGVFDVLDDNDGIITHHYMPGTYELTVRLVTSEGVEATDSIEFIIINPDNQPPVATLVADVTSGSAPLAVNLNPALSGDPDGQIILYEWDFNDDGTYDLMSETPAVQAKSFGYEGVTNVRLRVTDNDLATDSQQLSINVDNGWQVVGIDSNVVVSRAAVCISGLGAESFACVAYNDSDSDSLFFKSSGSNGMSWSARRVIDQSLDFTGHSPSLAYSVATQKLMAAFGSTDGVDHSLHFSSATDAQGSSWGSPVLVAGAAVDVGDSNSLAIVNNVPCIASVTDPHDAGESRVLYFQAGNQNGSSWQSAVEVMPAVAGESYRSMVLGIQGSGLFKRPIVAWTREKATLSEGIAVSLAADIDGNSFNPPSLIPAPLTDSMDFEIVNGAPAIAFGNRFGDTTLSFARADSGTGDSWSGEPSAVSNGNLPSLAIIDGRPAVCFLSSVQGTVLYARASDDNGTAWDPPMNVENSSGPSRCFLLNSNGTPLIIFYDYVNESLLASIWD